MASNKTITSANSQLLIGVTNIYPVAQLMQGYMADAAFGVEAIDFAELVMGVDGILSGGWIPQMNPQTISIMPNSPSSGFFETWLQAQNAAQDLFLAFGTLQMPSIGTKYTLQNGFLVKGMPHPEGRTVLQGRGWGITWNTITPAAM